MAFLASLTGSIRAIWLKVEASTAVTSSTDNLGAGVILLAGYEDRSLLSDNELATAVAVCPVVADLLLSVSSETLFPLTGLIEFSIFKSRAVID